jgi:hypothetical protein
MSAQTLTASRRFTPVEQFVADTVIAPMTLKTIRSQAVVAMGRNVPASTLSGAVANLVRWGHLSKAPRARIDPERGNLTGREMVYRKVSEARA